MLRHTAKKFVHSGLAAEKMFSYLEPSNRPPLFRRIRHRVARWPLWKKLTFAITAPLCLFGSYVGIATVIHELHRPTIDSLFDAEFPDNVDNILEDWKTVAPTLREGDIVLLMGTGSMSWKICNSQMVHSGLKASSLRYSHVGVVVRPMEGGTAAAASASGKNVSTNTGGVKTSTNNNSERVSSSSPTKRRTTSLFHIFDTSSSQKQQPNASTTSSPHKTLSPGPWMLEAVDNKDVNCVDENGIVRHDQVQIVAVGDRVYGVEQTDMRPCYHRFAVRRLQGFEWTPDRREKLSHFLSSHLARPMDKSPLIMLSYVSPALYEWAAPRLNNEIACSELIVDLYKAVGVIDEEANGKSKRESIQIAPYHFAEGNEGALELTHGVSLGPELRMAMKQIPKEKLYQK